MVTKTNREVELEKMLLCVMEAFVQKDAEIAYYKKIVKEGEYRRDTIEQLKGKFRVVKNEVTRSKRIIEDKDREIEDYALRLNRMENKLMQLVAKNRAYKLALRGDL